MGVFEVVAVTGAGEVCGHYTAIIRTVACAVLVVVTFKEFDAGNLSDGVGFVGRLELAGKQRIFAQGLFNVFWVDAAGAKEEEFFTPF
jgi:hypothetical protein